MYQQHSLEVFQRYFSLASWRLNYKEETHVSVRKLIRKDIFAYVEVIKAFMKTKKNGENIYRTVNAWLRNCRSILAFIKREINDTKREREREREREIGRKIML